MRLTVRPQGMNNEVVVLQCRLIITFASRFEATFAKGVKLSLA